MTGRRKFLKTVGATGAAGLIAGCTGDGGDGGSTNNSSDGGSGSGGSDGGSGGSDGGSGGSDGGSGSKEKRFNDGELDMNVSPSVAQDKLEAQYAPIRDYLSKELDIPAKMNIAKNYSVVIQALGAGTSDIAETGPFAAALGVKADKANIILQRKGYGSWTYSSIITTHKESDLSSLDDIKTAISNQDEFKISFADRLSTSGTLYPLYNLKKAGIDIGNLPEGTGSEASFTPVLASHTGSYEQLANDQVQVACMGGFVPGLQDNFDKEAKIIQKQKGLPRAPIVVSPKLSDEEQTAIQDAFLNAPDKIYIGSDGKADTEDDLWFNAVRKASVDKYQSVIEVANELGVGQSIFEG